MYKTIVLGATYAAAGIAMRQKKQCLILEQSFQAGYEFFGALNFGVGYETAPQTPEGEALRAQFFAPGITAYTRNTYIYPILQESNVLFGTQPVSIEKHPEGFLCQVYSIDDYRSFWAENVIDTRCNKEIAKGKTYNFLVKSAAAPEIPGVAVKPTGVEGQYVLSCPVSLRCDYSEAREIAEKVIRGFTQGEKLILLADEFDYQVENTLPETARGVARVVSKGYQNPICAFEAGLEVSK